MSAVEPLARIAVGVIVERRKAKSPWLDFVWQPVGVLAGEPVAAPWTVLDSSAERTTYYVGAADIQLYRSDCSSYQTNIATDAPQLWAALHATGTEPPYAIVAVTADPGEAEALAASGADLVEALPMPAPIRDIIEAFVAEHGANEEPFYKRKRDRADPEALARRAPAKDRR